MKKIKVVMNETHSLLPEQEALLNKKFGNWEILPCPASGWKLAEIEELAKALRDTTVVFCSPVPALMAQMQKPFNVFHNDRREAVELPNGKIIHKVAKEGWQLV